ncbi:MAG: PQQ-binding-like beta-propeller repeat protein [Thermoguttaceae bacterium]|nr:PQQ-binding-like beta-propeller repeat protein [Thermoguttaceae bacterium]
MRSEPARQVTRFVPLLLIFCLLAALALIRWGRPAGKATLSLEEKQIGPNQPVFPSAEDSSTQRPGALSTEGQSQTLAKFAGSDAVEPAQGQLVHSPGAWGTLGSSIGLLVDNQPPKPAKEANAPAQRVDFPFFRGDSRASGYVPWLRVGGLKERWRLAAGEGRVENTVTASGGVAYVGLSHGDLVAIDVDKGKPLWRFSSPGGWTAAPSVAHGRVYIGDGDGRFFCLDGTSGKVLWELRTEGPIDSPANVVDDLVLFGSQDGNLYCVDANFGQRRWTYTSEDQIRCFPTVADGRVLVAGCDGHLHVLELASGQNLFRVPLGGPTGNAAAVADGVAFVGTEHGGFAAIDILKGEVLWAFGDAGRPMSIRTSAAVSEELVFFGARDRKVRALKRKTGELAWEFTARSAVDSSPVVTAESVIFGADDGRLYVLDKNTGRQRAVYEVGGRISAPPAVYDSLLLIGTSQGEVVCWQIVPPG